MRNLRLALILLGSGVLSVAGEKAEAPKPRCSAVTQGMFWPEAANRDPRMRKRHAKEGSLELCQISGFRYRWKPMGTTVAQLVKRSGE